MTLKPWQTLSLVVAWAFACLFLFWLGVGAVEAWTLADGVPGNHITGAARGFVADQPHLALLSAVFVVVVVAVLTLLPGGVIAGHVLHDWSGKPRGRRGPGVPHLVVVALGLLVAGCASLPDVKPVSDPWPVKEDGTDYARCFEYKGNLQTSCCATEGPVVYEPWPRQTWTVYSCPADEPPAVDEPDDPPPTDEPPGDDPPSDDPPGDEEPPSDPPEPADCFAGPWVWHYQTCRPEHEAQGICRPLAPPPDQLGAEVHEAADRALEQGIREGWVVPISPNPHTGAPRGAVLEADLPRWAALVASYAEQLGLCAYAGPPHAQEEVRVFRPGQTTAEVHDVAIGGAPGGREWVGPAERHMPTIGYPRTGGAPVPAEDEPATACTVRGIAEGDGLKVFPSFEAACDAILSLLDWQGRNGGSSTRLEVIDGEKWHRDQGSGGGCFDAACNRYDDCGGTKVAGPEWLGVRCSP